MVLYTLVNRNDGAMVKHERIQLVERGFDFQSGQIEDL